VARNNNLIINGGTINNWASGGWSHNTHNIGNVENNTVDFYGGIVSAGGALLGGVSASRDAKGNTVNLYAIDGINSKIDGKIYGGLANSGESVNNVVNILEKINIAGTLMGDTIQSLNVYSKDNSVGAINGSIKNMHFICLPESVPGTLCLRLWGKPV
jgi:hypothetical protein